ncbi:RlmE family RNA methyltransferase [Methanobacterium alcaliphilum]|uniref:RlmE family RNA methyltransferase n=1 Tax=Methanobacterium alcaliphilum TaxID=392018 RepID=UPI00200A0D18|nr:SAM-dependent methyltransferase [Methanobacterium alcaliphilum]MCK9152292.1 23S rRNA (uridine(2552)-2'-O)-methyltransferase [Methanobacterium alcaliphilum]
MGKRWQVEKKNEHYYKSAKKENYRSRASYKILQLDKRFKIIKKGDKIVDLGAAPGGWSQIALEKIEETGMVLGVDLKRIKPFPEENFQFIQGDFTQKEIQDKIMEKIGGRANVIICDAAPSLSGIKDIDQLRSMDLAENVIKIAKNIMEFRGNLLMKTFQGPGYQELIKKFKKEFKIVKTTKPASSRKASSEMYIIGLGFKEK